MEHSQEFIDGIRKVVLEATSAGIAQHEHPKTHSTWSALLASLGGGFISGISLFVAIHTFWIRANDHLEVVYPEHLKYTHATRVMVQDMGKRVTKIEWMVNNHPHYQPEEN